MAAHDKGRWHAPPKASAIEVVDLLSDSDTVGSPPPETGSHGGKHDAYTTVLSAQDGDAQWRAPLQAPAVALDDSIAPNVSTQLGEVRANGDFAKACDASVEGSDSDEDSQWSLYEDALGQDEDEMAIHGSARFQSFYLSLAVANLGADDGSCTLEESIAFRKRLRLVGGDRFVAETVEAGVITAKKLCTAFGIRPPFFLDGEPDEAYYSLLDLAICRELSKRAKLPQHNTIDDAVSLLKKSRNIVVLTGAGVWMLWHVIGTKLMGTDLNKPRHSRLSIERNRAILPAPTSRPRRSSGGLRYQPLPRGPQHLLLRCQRHPSVEPEILPDSRLHPAATGQRQTFNELHTKYRQPRRPCGNTPRKVNSMSRIFRNGNVHRV